MSGFWANARMDSRSAPSAKILTWSMETRSGTTTNLLGGSLHDPIGSLSQRVRLDVGCIRAALAITIVHKNGAASGPLPGFDITPAISHEVAGVQIDIPGPGGFQHQAWLRLAARTAR